MSHGTRVPPTLDLAVDSSYRRDGFVDRGESRSSVMPGSPPLQAPSGQYTGPDGRHQTASEEDGRCWPTQQDMDRSYAGGTVMAG